MPKLNITYPDQIHPTQALQLVEMVVREGRISRANNIKKFCHATQIQTTIDGKQKDVMVITRNRRNNQSADSFEIHIESK